MFSESLNYNQFGFFLLLLLLLIWFTNALVGTIPSPRQNQFSRCGSNWWIRRVKLLLRAVLEFGRIVLNDARLGCIKTRQVLYMRYQGVIIRPVRVSLQCVTVSQRLGLFSFFFSFLGGIKYRATRGYGIQINWIGIKQGKNNICRNVVIPFQ